MRARFLTAAIAGTVTLVLAAQALAEVPVSESPAPGAVFTSGDPILFRANTPNLTPPPELAFYISRDGNVDPTTRVLANWFDQVRGRSVGGTPTAYEGSPDPDDNWPKKPGEYFWQAAEVGCTVAPCEGEVRSFTVVPLSAATVTSPAQIETFLNRHPKHRTRKRKVKFKFSSNVAGVRFNCLFASGWERCDSPHVFRHLQPGRYKFKVRAVVNKDLRDPTPAKWVFRVLRRHG